MKKLFGIIVVVALLVGGYFLWCSPNHNLVVNYKGLTNDTVFLSTTPLSDFLSSPGMEEIDTLILKRGKLKLNIDVSDETIEPMTKERYDEIVESETTSGLSIDESIAYIRYIREQVLTDIDSKNDNLYQDWTEAEMLREMLYHDRIYRMFEFFGLKEIGWAQRAKVVDFEEEQTFSTYLKRSIGNIFFW